MTTFNSDDPKGDSKSNACHSYQLNHSSTQRDRVTVGFKEEESDSESEDDEVKSSLSQNRDPVVRPRGKPEAMAAALASKYVVAHQGKMNSSSSSSSSSSDNNESSLGDDEPVADASVMEAEEFAMLEPAPALAVSKPKIKAKSRTSSHESLKSFSKALPPPSSKSKKTTGQTSGTSKKKKASTTFVTSTSKPKTLTQTVMHLRQRPPRIQHSEWKSLEDLMVLFCKVPLLAEFSRPVSLLHPELVAAYAKIVTHPVDLGHVCRGIRRRQYTCFRDIRLDMWRVFANCVKFHSHPHNKEAVPSFVSIALHLREYFNMLWQEFMITSDLPEDASEMTRQAFSKRSEDRQKRIETSGPLTLSKPYVLRTANFMTEFLEKGGRVDDLDLEPVFTEPSMIINRDLRIVYQRLKALTIRLAKEEDTSDEYSLEAFYKDVHGCLEGEILSAKPSLLNRIRGRLDRLVWKRTLPLHEGYMRGVAQSSIWGNSAAFIWARENSKKPYWPALCLGILPPCNQREGWHAAVTERNESRLPEKLRVQLVAAKKKYELVQKRQNISYFMVEFLGTHEFIWVRELDIIDKFDATEDPNKSASVLSKTKRASRSDINSVLKSKTYATALEECKWAQEEFDDVLQDALEEYSQRKTDSEVEDFNYSFSTLAQSDDEADNEDMHGFFYDEEAMSDSDAEEANFLLAHDGMLDMSAIGAKKKNKKRPALVTSKKKSQATTDKEKKDAGEAHRKSKTDQMNKAQVHQGKKDLVELEKRRRKRVREREKIQRDEARKHKRRFSSIESINISAESLKWDKRIRATAISKAYATRATHCNEDYKSLALSGVMQLPSALVDPTGLLGMALAFRAAAGILNMPDESEEKIIRSTKPWVAIDTTSASTSSERTSNLEIRMKMLDNEIHRVRSNTRKRRQLTKEAKTQLATIDNQIEVEDLAARVNHYQRRKKPFGKTSYLNIKATATREVGLEDESFVEVEDDASVEDDTGDVVVAEIFVEEDEHLNLESTPISEVMTASTDDLND